MDYINSVPAMSVGQFVSGKSVLLCHVYTPGCSRGHFLLRWLPICLEQQTHVFVQYHNCTEYSEQACIWSELGKYKDAGMREKYELDGRTKQHPSWTLITSLRYCFLALFQCLSNPKTQGLMTETSDAGSQYRCGRVGRGIQPQSTPHTPTINTQTHPQHSNTQKKYQKCSFSHFSTRWPLPTNQRTDKASYRVACPQLKMG